MYSVVLMAAMTTGVDLPELGGRRGGGCCGCYGGGGGGHGRRGGRGGGCCGCYGGGYGYGGGCMGMGYGYGGGCWGGGYGGGYGGCMGMGMGMGYGGCMGMGYGGCMGMGGMGYGGGCTGMGYGGGMGIGGGMILQGGTTGGTGGEKLQTKPKVKEEESYAPTSATILVQLPAEAKLRIDNEATTSTGGSRLFQTPALNPGKEYHYTLTAEITRDGKPVKAEQVVTVRAGQTTPVTLTLPKVGVAQR